MTESDRIRALEEKSLELERLLEELDEVVRGTNDRVDGLLRELATLRRQVDELGEEEDAADDAGTD